jgi:hypothetical protein
MFAFIGKIYKLGINPVIDPPDDVLQAVFEQAGRSRGPIPVRGKVNGAEFVQTLVKYRGAWRLYINGPMLAASGSRAGDNAHIEIEFDDAPREIPVPQRFADALANHERAKAAFDELSPSRQKEILKYLGYLKTEASLDRNIEKVIRQLSNDRSL